MTQTKLVNRTPNDLHPLMRPCVARLETELLKDGILGTNGASGFRLFEGYREPNRQTELLAQKATKASAWKSAHQFGLAVDYVWYWWPVVNDAGQYMDARQGWDWHVAASMWDRLGVAGSKAGLDQLISWDRPHLEHPAFKTLKAAIRT